MARSNKTKIAIIPPQRSVATSLADRALLVNLRIRMWSARKLDRKETADLAVRHGITEGVARVNKALLPHAPALEKLQTAAASLRTFYYSQTLPWAVDGSQMLPAKRYMAFASDMRDRLDVWHTVKREFLAEYPTYRTQAQSALNGLFNSDDYPEPDLLERRFDADLRFFPIPDADDFRVQLGTEELERMSRAVEKTAEEALAAGTRNCWDRLHVVVSRAVERLSSPDAVFRDSLVENAKELCGLLTDLNLADDPHLEDMRQQVERTLASQNPEALRSQPALRAEVAEQLADMERKMGAFML